MGWEDFFSRIEPLLSRLNLGAEPPTDCVRGALKNLKLGFGFTSPYRFTRDPVLALREGAGLSTAISCRSPRRIL
jgi:hypothetical protein